MTIKGRKVLKDCVMNAIADDYENFEHISRWVNELLEAKGMKSSTKEIAQALHEVIDEGNAQAYELSPTVPHSVPVNFSTERLSELWFYLTPQGIANVKPMTRWSRTE